MARQTLSVVIYREGDQYVARCLDVEVSSFGATREEAEAMIAEALELHLEDQVGRDELIPVAEPRVHEVEVNVGNG
ncbi:hypothetical protein SUDANB121_03595 [Nocardiopsis dassonvillei]|uniref:type II toxin-antitoxin system HicB family antitoxin n=1 Tax=Nocardiopsis dassonvillei TaxID=2014 RepID=UPI003F55A956